MIHNLQGIHETVDYKADTQICLYYNKEAENYPPHWHPSFEVIMPVINDYRVVCGHNDYLIKEGEILVICPCILHELFAPATGERIIFQPSLNHIKLKELDLITPLLSPAILVTKEEYPQVYEHIHRLMLEIKDEYMNFTTYSEISIIAKFLEIFVDIGRNHKAFHQQDGDRDIHHQKEYMEKFLFITDYISNHFSENLTLEEVASLAGFSKYHFARLFKQYTNSSFYKFLNQKRIEYAKSLLLDPELAVTEVAVQSGFSSLSAFLRMFKQLNLCTPTEFRNMYDSHFQKTPQKQQHPVFILLNIILFYCFFNHLICLCPILLIRISIFISAKYMIKLIKNIRHQAFINPTSTLCNQYIRNSIKCFCNTACNSTKRVSISTK